MPESNNPTSSIELLKHYGPNLTLAALQHPEASQPTLQAAIAGLVADKEYSIEAIRRMGETAVFGSALGGLIMRYGFEYFVAEILNNIAANLAESDIRAAIYTGTNSENYRIDGAIARNPAENDLRTMASHGATRTLNFSLSLANIKTLAMKRSVVETPIVIIGGGFAGLLSAVSLIELGFNPDRITVLDRAGVYNGIWEYRNVYGGSKNNPRPLRAFNKAVTGAAPGPGSSIRQFLNDLYASTEGQLAPPIKALVTSVTPGDLQHIVKFKSVHGEEEISAPIVINAIGLGRPLHPNNPRKIATSTPEYAGIRWQQQLTDKQAEKLSGQTVILIGLGNSTAEMLVQFQELNRKGYKIDYRVLTHYPRAAINYPAHPITRRGQVFRVFRDLELPTLTKLAGDLPQIREAFEIARDSGRIIPDVSRWKANGKIIEIQTRNPSNKSFDYEKFPYAQIYTLIGYGHDPKTLRAMGMHVTDDRFGFVAADYDGELHRPVAVQDRNQRRKLSKGYFGAGSILKNEFNPNAVVAPGMFHRLGDTMFSVAVRAFEYSLRMT